MGARTDASISGAGVRKRRRQRSHAAAVPNRANCLHLTAAMQFTCCMCCAVLDCAGLCRTVPTWRYRKPLPPWPAAQWTSAAGRHIDIWRHCGQSPHALLAARNRPSCSDGVPSSPKPNLRAIAATNMGLQVGDCDSRQFVCSYAKID